MPLKIETKLTHYVDYFDLEDFIEGVYGKEPQIVAMEEAANDASLTFEVDGKLDTDDMKNLVVFLKTGFVMYGTEMLLNALCHGNHIPAGSYVVKVGW